VKTRLLVLSCLFTLFTVVSTYGQESSITSNIPFQFTSTGKAFPAGEYKFTRNAGMNVFTIAGPGKVSGLAQVITRIAGAMHTTPADAHLVFDKLGDTYILSEIWIPGEDGYMFNVTKEKHTHKIVDVPR